MLMVMRFLGIDYGSKRIGVALSDEKGNIAFPHSVLPNTEELVKEIKDITEKEQVGGIVIGHSLNREGGSNPIHEDVSDFIASLTVEIGIPIELEPEQYTTQEAIRLQGKNEKTDASAAAIILNSYLTKTKNKQT